MWIGDGGVGHKCLDHSSNAVGQGVRVWPEGRYSSTYCCITNALNTVTKRAVVLLCSLCESGIQPEHSGGMACFCSMMPGALVGNHEGCGWLEWRGTGMVWVSSLTCLEPGLTWKPSLSGTVIGASPRSSQCDVDFLVVWWAQCSPGPYTMTPRTGVPSRPGGSCIAFYHEASWVT